MANKVAVQKNLDHIVRGLQDLGYVVEQFDKEYRGDAQTIIYSAYKSSAEESNSFECVTNNLFTDHSYGALIVNGDGRDPKEIDQVIKNRIYSPLF